MASPETVRSNGASSNQFWFGTDGSSDEGSFIDEKSSSEGSVLDATLFNGEVSYISDSSKCYAIAATSPILYSYSVAWKVMRLVSFGHFWDHQSVQQAGDLKIKVKDYNFSCGIAEDAARQTNTISTVIGINKEWSYFGAAVEYVQDLAIVLMMIAFAPVGMIILSGLAVYFGISDAENGKEWLIEKLFGIPAQLDPYENSIVIDHFFPLEYKLNYYTAPERTFEPGQLTLTDSDMENPHVVYGMFDPYSPE